MKCLRKFSALIVIALALINTSCNTSDEVILQDPPRAIFSFGITDDTIVAFSNFSVGGDSYIWDYADGTTSTEESPIHTYTVDGKYKVKLTVINTGGSAEVTKEITIDRNLISGGDMSDAKAWTFKQIWNDPNNKVNASFSNGVFLLDADPQTNYAQAYLWQEVAINAGKTYKFSTDIASTSGAENIWFELYFGNVDPSTSSDYDSNGKRLNINSSGCAANTFNGNFVTIARPCDNSGTKILKADGTFTLSTAELTKNGSVYVVFKSGTWNSFVNYKDGITIDNVSITEKL
ncbi:MAG: PKD repeat protein [Glaciecola sp.]|jgi:PKD repeat protein